MMITREKIYVRPRWNSATPGRRKMEETYIYEPIDLEECFDPVFEPPEDFLEECGKYRDENQSPFTTVVERKIGNTSMIC